MIRITKTVRYNYVNVDVVLIFWHQIYKAFLSYGDGCNKKNVDHSVAGADLGGFSKLKNETL